MRVALVSCSATKANEPRPARELYQGDLFRMSVTWIEARAAAYPRWAILSAKHGLVVPDQVLTPYDTQMESVDSRAWAAHVAEQIEERWGLAGVIYTVLAGERYTSPLHGRVPLLEDVFGYWRRCHAIHHPRGKWGIGKIKQALSQGREYGC
jgi:hypothetical protein